MPQLILTVNMFLARSECDNPWPPEIFRSCVCAATVCIMKLCKSHLTAFVTSIVVIYTTSPVHLV